MSKIGIKDSAATWKKCPKCGSHNYKRSRTVDRVITHKDGKVTTSYTNPVMPWLFECLSCGFGEFEYQTGATI